MLPPLMHTQQHGEVRLALGNSNDYNLTRKTVALAPPFTRIAADAGLTGWVFTKRTPPHTYGRWGANPRTSGLTHLR